MRFFKLTIFAVFSFVFNLVLVGNAPAPPGPPPLPAPIGSNLISDGFAVLTIAAFGLWMMMKKR
ncbi:MAG: hypothetical protein ACYSTI_12645 [Planctomycetota bacterium]|jgi:hypothetical protein